MKCHFRKLLIIQFNSIQFNLVNYILKLLISNYILLIFAKSLKCCHKDISFLATLGQNLYYFLKVEL